MKYLNRMICFSAMLFMTLLLSSCFSGPDNGIKPVGGFDAGRYMGVWYEQGRYPHSFEKGLTDVRAEYRLDGESVIVVNSGYDSLKGKWSSIKGSAYFPGSSSEGELRVCFFWPFYGTYRIVWLEPDYSAAIVTSYGWDYLWILSREQKMSAEKYNDFESRAVKMGFSKDLIYRVPQTRSIPAEK